MNTLHAQSIQEVFTDKPFFLLTLKGRVIAGAAILAVGILLSGVFFYGVYAQITPYMRAVSAVGGLPAAVVATSTSNSVPMRELHIANDGLTLVRGARVVASTGNVITISLMWGGAEFRWLVDTGSNTAFLTSAGEKAAIIDIQPGDIITVTGMLTTGGSVPAISAQSVRGL